MQSLILGVIATICLASPAAPGDVQLRILGLRNTGGDVRAAVCNEGEFLASRCALRGTAAASAGAIVIKDVPPGQYAVQAFHDENGNGLLDRTSLGRPAEGMAFSRDAPMRFGPPKYRDAVVQVPPEGGILSITMRYF